MRYELSDYEWFVIKPILPNKPRGVQRVNDRVAVQMIDTAVVRVHQHGACIADNNHQDMGRSQGGPDEQDSRGGGHQWSAGPSRPHAW